MCWELAESSLLNLGPGLREGAGLGWGLGLCCRGPCGPTRPRIPSSSSLVESVLRPVQARVGQWSGSQEEPRFVLVLGGGTSRAVRGLIDLGQGVRRGTQGLGKGGTSR